MVGMAAPLSVITALFMELHLEDQEGEAAMPQILRGKVG